jgi:NAD(P)H-quinone oxidoreductase subunit 5
MVSIWTYGKGGYMQEFLSLAWWPGLYALGLLITFACQGQSWTLARGVALVAFAGVLTAVPASILTSGVHIDYLAIAMALMVSLLGWVIVQYSARYLEGEPGQARFVRAMLFTLASVSLLVVSRNLLTIILAWAGTSIGMHHLLTYYRDRKSAQIVAHKKFIASRIADTCLIGALVLVYQASGSLKLDALSSHLAGLHSLPISLHLAACLFALAAILKSAQLPLHGWLIQVMEAPTPVSAILHAGVVNIGGFVLIRLADLLALAPAAQTLLVIVGSLTATLASLVMMTRISIKVRLAWSTCAQMGFMLMEIGLGLYELALLHLFAHSCYKAHAFLSAGEAVATARQQDFDPIPGRSRSPLWYAGTLLLSIALVAISLAAWQWWMPALNLPFAALLIFALGLAPLLWLESGISAGLFGHGALRVLVLAQLYLLWHYLFSGIAPAASPAMPALLAWSVAAISVLYVVQVWLRTHPSGQLARLLYPWVYCGFYLDETFTRITFRLWPVRLTPAQAQTIVNRQKS